MISFEVKDMTCGHCVGAITRAVHAVEPGAQLKADLALHRVHIESTVADAGALGAAIKEAGYASTLLAGPAASPETPTSASRRTCCCR